MRPPSSPFYKLCKNLKLPTLPKMECFSTGNRSKEKVIVIMGPTGSGKSRLSVDLSTRFPGEIINSDKIQVYKGLDITTNKIPPVEQLGVTHHLLGDIDSLSHGEFTPSHFRSRASHVVNGILSRGKVPYIVGGSNSFIYSLLAENYDPNSDVLTQYDSEVCTELRYECCFLWVDVSVTVLNEYLKKRVDEMIESGMVEELAGYYDSPEFRDSVGGLGLRKAIGVPEFEEYFKRDTWRNEQTRKGLFEKAVREIKENTCRLAKTQMEKIQRLRLSGWDLKKIDGSDSFREVLEGKKSWSDVWDRQVLKPSMKIVKSFLEDE